MHYKILIIFLTFFSLSSASARDFDVSTSAAENNLFSACNAESATRDNCNAQFKDMADKLICARKAYNILKLYALMDGKLNQVCKVNWTQLNTTQEITPTTPTNTQNITSTFINTAAPRQIFDSKVAQVSGLMEISVDAGIYAIQYSSYAPKVTGATSDNDDECRFTVSFRKKIGTARTADGKVVIEGANCSPSNPEGADAAGFREGLLTVGGSPVKPIFSCYKVDGTIDHDKPSCPPRPPREGLPLERGNEPVRHRNRT